MNHVKFVNDVATGSQTNREDRRDRFSKIRQGRREGFVQSSNCRQTCTRLEKTDKQRMWIGANRFGALDLNEGGQDFEEVNSVHVVQEIVEITVDSGAVKSV